MTNKSDIGVQDQDQSRLIAKLQQKAEVLEKLQQKEQDTQFRLFVEAVQDYAIFMLDSTGHVHTWNLGAQRIKQYSAADIIGKHFSIFYPEEDKRNDKQLGAK